MSEDSRFQVPLCWGLEAGRVSQIQGQCFFQLLLLPKSALLKKSTLAHVAQGKKWVLSLG